MTNILKIALVSLAVLAGASVAQAGSTSAAEDVNIDTYFDDQTLNGGGGGY